jgi:glycosyltransferase involved in cell wall biosynthesis
MRRMESLPTVSALMAAYNYEQYVARAIESALAQDYPPELLEVVVIDDGSTDSTAEVVRGLAEANPGRVRLIQQANSGYVAATNRGLAEGTGEMLALLDADDMWLPAKTRRQVEMFQARPELGMVFSDMVVVDADEQTVRPSLIWAQGELPERAFARVLHENVATQSSIMIRASLREHVAPIPPGVPYADWWITLRAAQFSALDYSREPLALYRVHGSNLTGDVSGPAAVREAGKYVAFQLWALRNLPLSLLSPEEMIYVWNGIEAQAQRAVQAAGSYFVSPAERVPELIAQVDGLLESADVLAGRGDYEGEAEVLLRALAYDPYRVGSRERLQECVTAIQAAASLPDPLEGARALVVLADAEDLLAGDDLLLAYAAAMGGSEGVTLAIDATRMPVDLAGDQLQQLVERCQLEARDDIELFAVVGQRESGERHRLMAGIRALYRRELPEQPEAAQQASRLPVFTPATLDGLKTLAA